MQLLQICSRVFRNEQSLRSYRSAFSKVKTLRRLSSLSRSPLSSTSPPSSWSHAIINAAYFFVQNPAQSILKRNRSFASQAFRMKRKDVLCNSKFVLVFLETNNLFAWSSSARACLFTTALRLSSLASPRASVHDASSSCLFVVVFYLLLSSLPFRHRLVDPVAAPRLLTLDSQR